MTSLLSVVHGVEHEIDMADQCLANILARLDEDIARINERKVQIAEEFYARRCSLEALIGANADYQTPDADKEQTNDD